MTEDLQMMKSEIRKLIISGNRMFFVKDEMWAT